MREPQSTAQAAKIREFSTCWCKMEAVRFSIQNVISTSQRHRPLAGPSKMILPRGSSLFSKSTGPLRARLRNRQVDPTGRPRVQTSPLCYQDVIKVACLPHLVLSVAYTTFSLSETTYLHIHQSGLPAIDTLIAAAYLYHTSLTSPSCLRLKSNGRSPS